MRTHPHNSARRARGGTGLAGVALAAIVLGGCGAEDSEAARPDRAAVTITATDTSIDAPDTVPSGYVDLHLVTEPSTTPEAVHHIFVARLDDGVTLEEAFADDESFFTKMTIKGGNGSIAAGEDVTMTLDLEPGNYFVLDNPQNEDSPSDAFTVVDSGDRGIAPDAKGVVTLGPGMVIDAPDNFDATGVWEFVNDDTEEVHEAALVKLADGATADDVIAWFGSDHSTPPPIDGEFGSMGALGPGQRAWIEIGPVDRGEYALICFIPGRDGIPHIMKGMVTPVTVTR